MTDSEIVQWCAKALNLHYSPLKRGCFVFEYRDQMWTFDPLNDDAHVGSLIKLFQPLMSFSDRDAVWRVHIGFNENLQVAVHSDFNRAVATCAAKYYKYMETTRRLLETPHQ